MPVPDAELLDWDREFWIMSCWSISSCSLVKRLVLVEVGLSSETTTLWALLYLSLNGLDGFQSASFPWIFQQFSLECPSFRQWSHQGLPLFWRFSLLVFDGDPRATRAEFWDPIITFFLLSSRRTSENASLMLGRGLVSITLPLTSSKFLLRPMRNLNVCFCSTIFPYSAVSLGHF